MSEAVVTRPMHSHGWLRSKPALWARENLFSSWLSTAITLVLAYLLFKIVLGVASWALFNAVWTVDGTNTQACRAVKGVGACWALIAEKHRFILFGTYPFEDQWREMLTIVIFIALYVVSAMRRFWNIRLIAIWVVGLATIAVVMWGGVFGLRYVEDERWGGLAITLILATFAIAVSFPIGILLALGRRSDMPAIKAVSVIYIELIRGVPLVSLLIMASVMLPLVNIFIAVFKDTSLVLIIGIFDLMTAAKNTTIEPAWRGFGLEAYVFVSLIYFAFCFSMSRYSQRIEADLARSRNR